MNALIVTEKGVINILIGWVHDSPVSARELQLRKLEPPFSRTFQAPGSRESKPLHSRDPGNFSGLKYATNPGIFM